MSNQLLAWNNYVLSASLAAGSATTALPVINLTNATGAPSAAWQTASGVTTRAGGATLTITPPIPDQTWRALGLFRTNLSPAASVLFSLYQSPAALVWAASSMGPFPGFGQVVAVPPTDIVADYAVIGIDDPGNPDGFLNIPLCFAGPAWQMASAADYATTYGLDNLNDEAVSRGGQEYSQMRWERRRWEVTLQGIRATEVLGPIAAVNQVARTATNILWVPDFTNDQSLHMEACYGRVTSTADVGYPYGASDRRSWKFRVQERL